MSLQELFYSEIDFKLKAVEEKIRFRKFSLNDEMYAEKLFPDGIPLDLKDLKEDDFENLFKLVYSLIENKYLFKAIEIKDLDDNGEEITKKVFGFELFKYCISSNTEQIGLIMVLSNIISNSRPMRLPSENENEDEDKKKEK